MRLSDIPVFGGCQEVDAYEKFHVYWDMVYVISAILVVGFGAATVQSSTGCVVLDSAPYHLVF